jgi:Protein of unknown function (DUF664)
MMAAMATTRRADILTEDGRPSDDDPREHSPRLGDERVTLAEALRSARLTLEMKCAGLDAQALARRSVEPSTMSLLGLVRHLAEGERATFRVLLAGEDAPRLFCSDDDRDGDFDGAVPDPVVVAEAWDAWRTEVEFATRFVAEAPSLDITGDDPQPAWQRRRSDVAARGAGRDDLGVRPAHGARRPAARTDRRAHRAVDASANVGQRGPARTGDASLREGNAPLAVGPQPDYVGKDLDAIADQLIERYPADAG